MSSVLSNISAPPLPQTRQPDFQTWLAQGQIPAGFTKWGFVYNQWKQGNTLSYAIWRFTCATSPEMSKSRLTPILLLRKEMWNIRNYDPNLELVTVAYATRDEEKVTVHTSQGHFMLPACTKVNGFDMNRKSGGSINNLSLEAIMTQGKPYNKFLEEIITG